MCSNCANQQPTPWATMNPNLNGLLDNWAAGDYVYLLTAGGLVQGTLSALGTTEVRLSNANIITSAVNQGVAIANIPYTAILTAGK